MAKRKTSKDNGKSIRKKLATLVTTSGKNIPIRLPTAIPPKSKIMPE